MSCTRRFPKLDGHFPQRRRDKLVSPFRCQKLADSAERAAERRLLHCGLRAFGCKYHNSPVVLSMNPSVMANCTEGKSTFFARLPREIYALHFILVSANRFLFALLAPKFRNRWGESPRLIISKLSTAISLAKKRILRKFSPLFFLSWQFHGFESKQILRDLVRARSESRGTH